MPSHGASTKIAIRGLIDLSEKEALQLLGNRIEHVVGNAPSPSRADDAAFLLENALHKEGFPEAHVEWAIPPKQNVIELNVLQGPIRYIGKIFVTGVTSELKTTIISYFTNSTIGLKILAKDATPYNPDDIDTDIKNATSFLHSKGYWNASISLEKTEIFTKQGLVNLHLHVNKGVLYSLTQPIITGHQNINISPLKKSFRKLFNQPASTTNINAIHKKTTEYFMSQGYSFVNVELEQKLTQDKAQLHLTVSPGKKHQIGNIRITGLEKTKPSVIRRRINKSLGSFYSPATMHENRKRFLKTGAFKSLIIDTDPRNDGYIDMTLKFQEGRARGVGAHIGAGSYEGFILGISYLDQNFLGRLQNLSISTEYSDLGFLGQASISDSMFRGSDLAYTLRTFILKHELEGYSKVETGLGSEIIWNVNDFYSLRFYGDILLTRSNSKGLPNETLGLREYTALRAGVSNKFDFRDNKLRPRKGFYGEIVTEAGVVNNPDTHIPYSRLIFRSSYRQPINSDDYLVFFGHTGFLFSDNSNDFPIDLRYFMGGSDSVRSFPERKMSPYVNGHPTGGETYWVASAEYNRKIKDSVYMNLFLDSGSLARKFSDIKSADVKFAAGLGVWLDLPIGPMRAEYGYNLNRESGEPAGTFHFSVGISF